jgi:UDP-N-acetylmuramoylalanine--D-glutamate ligase
MRSWYIPDVQGQKIAVVGLGISGEPLARALKNAGAHIFLWDDGLKESPPGLPALTPMASIPWPNLDALALSPGIPHTFPKPHPFVAEALKHHVPITSDIHYFLQSTPKAITIGITGTNGKSTTAHFLYQALKKLGKTVDVGGNFGNACFSMPPPQKKTKIHYVLELSSFQLEITPFLDLDQAIFLGIAPDHLDRYPTFEAYCEAKLRIFLNASKPRRLILNADTPLLQEQASKGHLRGATLTWISTTRRLKRGFSLIDQHLYEDGEHPTLVQTAQPLPFLATYAALRDLGVTFQEAAHALEESHPLAHRLEPVRTFQKTTFINDSKATNIDAMAYAIHQQNTPFILLCGGSDKGERNFEALLPLPQELKAVHCFGPMGEHFKGFFQKNGTPSSLHKEMEGALTQAIQESPPIILLSPGAASFDQFQNFQERGNIFREFVQKLSSKER